jgi:hypothetical protein
MMAESAFTCDGTEPFPADGVRTSNETTVSAETPIEMTRLTMP